MVNPLVEGTGFGFGRGFETRAVDIEEPTVQRATKPTVFEPTESQVDSAVGAETADQAELPLFVDEKHELFTHEGYLDNRAVTDQFLAESRRLPILAQDVTTLSSRA